MYVRIFTVTNEYIKTNSIQFNEAVSLQPKVLWHNKKGLKKFFSRFSTQSALNINRKTQQSDEISIFNPFIMNIEDTSLVFINSSIQNSLFYRNASKYSIELSQNDSRNKMVMSNGAESRQLEEYGANFRWNMTQSFTLSSDYNEGFKINDYGLLANKNYQIHFNEIKPSISYIAKNVFRLTVSFSYRVNENAKNYGGENAILRESVSEIRYNVLAKSTLNARFSYVTTTYSGENNTPVSYAMLEGLQKGRNMLWSLTLEKQLSKQIQLSLSYDGTARPSPAPSRATEPISKAWAVRRAPPQPRQTLWAAYSSPPRPGSASRSSDAIGRPVVGALRPGQASALTRATVPTSTAKGESHRQRLRPPGATLGPARPRRLQPAVSAAMAAFTVMPIMRSAATLARPTPSVVFGAQTISLGQVAPEGAGDDDIEGLCKKARQAADSWQADLDPLHCQDLAAPSRP